jgi:hypothetical protein
MSADDDIVTPQDCSKGLIGLPLFTCSILKAYYRPEILVRGGVLLPEQINQLQLMIVILGAG